MENLYGRSRAGLVRLAEELGLPAYRGRQLFRHLYRRGRTDLREMTDLGESLRAELAARFTVRPPRLVGSEESGDGAVKLLVELEDGLRVETVAIGSRREAAGGRSGRAPIGAKEPSDLTVCVSTQAGCPLACTFCRSGAVPFLRNLTPGEIAGQVLLTDRATPHGGRRNVVYMGMGEPLLNTEAVIASLELLTDPDGFGIPPRRITVSTVGLPEEIGRLGRAVPAVGLAISLHAGDDETRGRFMPIGRRHRTPEIFAALRKLPPAPRRRITIEYVLLGGENDRPEDARALLARLRHLAAEGIRPHVNLIAFNPWSDPAPGPPHRPGTEEDAEHFLRIVAAGGFVATLRRSRGRDVLAACGQLAATPPAS